MTYVLFLKNPFLFPSYRNWKSTVNSQLFRMRDSPLQAVSVEVPNVKLVHSAFACMNPNFYWSLGSEVPDLVPKRRTQLRFMVNAGLQGGVPWLRNSSKSICPICKSEEEDNYHFLLRCKAMRPEFDLLWSKLFSLIQTKATFEANVIINFLEDHNKVGLKLSFQHSTSVSIVRFIMVSSLSGFVTDSLLVASSLPIALLSHFMQLHAGL